MYLTLFLEALLLLSLHFVFINMFICATSHTKRRHFVLQFIVVVCRCSATFSFTNLQSFCNVVFRLSSSRQCSCLELQPLLLMQTVHCAFKDCTWTQICFLMHLYFHLLIFAQNKVNAVARFIFYGLCGCLFFSPLFFYIMKVAWASFHKL